MQNRQKQSYPFWAYLKQLHSRLEENKHNKEQRKAERLAQLEELKTKDPELYAAQKAIFFPAKTNQK